MASTYLPTHLLTEIFCRLGVESLVRCTCVCKTWHHVIHTTCFANIHLTYQKTSSNANKYLLYQEHGSCTLLTRFEPLPDYDHHSELYYSPELFERDFNIRDGCQLRIHGMCDGLLCISKDGISDDLYTYFKREYRVGDNLHLWNPMCRKAKKLPELKISKEYDGFIRKGVLSFGCYNNDYKVIVISTIDHMYDVSVYSLSTNCWKIIHTNCYYEDEDNNADFYSVPQPTKIVGGVSYYMIRSTNLNTLVVCFDLRDETIQQVRCPDEFDRYRTKFAMEAYGETIAVLGCNDDSGYLDMWIILRDKLSSKPYLEKKLEIQLQEVGFSLPVGFIYNNKYMVATCKYDGGHEEINFFLYDLESEDVTKYEYPLGRDCVINADCVESLFLLNEDSVHPFVHKEMESSCSSMLFTLRNYLHMIPIPLEKVHLGKEEERRLRKEVFQLTEEGIADKFAKGLTNVTSVALSLSYPSISAASSMFINAYKNVLALSVATDYTFKQAQEVKEFFKDNNSVFQISDQVSLRS